MPETSALPHALIQQAAAVVLLRDAANGPQLFFARRHGAMDFMPDQYVFPGGKVEASESPRHAAVRELFEEAGVFLGGGSGQYDAQLMARIEADHGLFQAHFGAEAITAALCSLVPWTRWLTPAGQSRRFDTRFYLALLPAGQHAWDANDESTHGVWLEPEAALAEHVGGQLPLPVPQLTTCLALRDAGCRSTAEVLDYARPLNGTDERVIPVQDKRSSVVTCLLPWDEEYFACGEGEMQSVSANHHLRRLASRLPRQKGIWQF